MIGPVLMFSTALALWALAFPAPRGRAKIEWAVIGLLVTGFLAGIALHWVPCFNPS